jgi:pimeloyl-ACP methyl ester carboxylesterase
MRFLSETTVDGVSERQFLIDDVPGVLWTPAGDDGSRPTAPGGGGRSTTPGGGDRSTASSGARPLILLAHGGGQSRMAPGMVGRARRFVGGSGFAAMALDAPGHGDRPRTERDLAFTADLRRRMTAGEPVAEMVADDNFGRAERAVGEWRAALDALEPVGPVGFLGVSMGGAIGIPLVAAEPRIRAAVIGLVGHPKLHEPAARITIPLEFLLQWEDEFIPREAGLAMFDAFGSAEKSLHVNPGGHGALPRFEVDSADRFFRRHLTPPDHA